MPASSRKKSIGAQRRSRRGGVVAVETQGEAREVERGEDESMVAVMSPVEDERVEVEQVERAAEDVGASGLGELGAGEGEEGQTGGNIVSTQAILADPGPPSAQPTPRQTQPTIRILQQELHQLRDQVEALTANRIHPDIPALADVYPKLAYLHDVLLIEARGLDVLLERDDVVEESSSCVVFAPERAEVKELRRLGDGLRAALGAVEVLQAQCVDLTKRVDDLYTSNEATERRLQELESANVRASQRSTASSMGIAGGAAEPTSPSTRQYPSSSLPARTGGGGNKTHNLLHRAFIDYVRMRLGVGSREPLPDFDVHHPTTTKGRQLLRIDWSRPNDAEENLRIVGMYMHSATLLEDDLVRAMVERIGKQTAQRVCLQSLERLFRTYRDQQAETEEDRQQRLRNKRRRQRRQKKWVKRKKHLASREDIQARYGNHDFLVEEAMSGDETGDEEVLAEQEGNEVVHRNREVGLVDRVPWRSRELEDAIRAVDEGIRGAQGTNARQARTLIRRPTARAPPNPATAPRLPQTVYKWMVAERYAQAYPLATARCANNHPPTPANRRETRIHSVGEWGNDPAFTMTMASAEPLPIPSPSVVHPPIAPGTLNNSLDPRLGLTQSSDETWAE
uniref:Uncharacterized protein n=1 Tax=Kalmanozyma brasiliensis (strain GHG001) TaxID=1365824 RepID=V5EFN3_KALBG